MSQSAVSARYTEALIDAAEERSALDRVEADVQGLLELLDASDDLRAFAADPMIRSERKKTVFRNLFSGKIDGLTLNFLLLLCANHRERILENLLKDFLDALDARRGIATAQVVSAIPLSSEQQARLAQRLSGFSGKQVRLETEVDENLKAGFVARLGDQVFDGSLATQLNRLRQRLVTGV